MVTRDKSAVHDSGNTKVHILLDAVTATTTSAALPVAGAKKISLYFTRADHSAGSTAFSVTVSADNSTYVAYNKLVSNATNAISEGLIRVASVSLGANGTSMVSMDLQHDALMWIKATATETTDGTHTIVAVVEY